MEQERVVALSKKEVDGRGTLPENVGDGARGCKDMWAEDLLSSWLRSAEAKTGGEEEEKKDDEKGRRRKSRRKSDDEEENIGQEQKEEERRAPVGSWRASDQVRKISFGGAE